MDKKFLIIILIICIGLYILNIKNKNIDEGFSSNNYNEYNGWSKNLNLYSKQTTPCNLEDYKSNLANNEGYYWDPLSNNKGWCRTIPSENVDKVKKEYNYGNWTSNNRGITYLPNISKSNNNNNNNNNNLEGRCKGNECNYKNSLSMVDPFVYNQSNYYNARKNSINFNSGLDNLGKFKNFKYWYKVPQNARRKKDMRSKNIILHKVLNCKQCTRKNWCNPDQWALNIPNIEKHFRIGSPISNNWLGEFGCFQIGNNTPVVRNSDTGDIYAVEMRNKNLGTLHWVNNCYQCGRNWCNSADWAENNKNIDSMYNLGPPLAKIGCNQVNQFTLVGRAGGGRNSINNRIYAIKMPKESRVSYLYKSNNWYRLRKWFVTNLDIVRDYEVGFQIYPYSRVAGWSNILHFSISNRDCCSENDRTPAIWFYPNSLRLHVRAATTSTRNDGLDPGYQLPTNSVTQVRIIAKGNRLTVKYYNRRGQLIVNQSKIQNGTRGLGRAKVYLSDPWYRSANASVRNVYYKSLI